MSLGPWIVLITIMRFVTVGFCSTHAPVTLKNIIRHNGHFVLTGFGISGFQCTRLQPYKKRCYNTLLSINDYSVPDSFHGPGLTEFFFRGQ